MKILNLHGFGSVGNTPKTESLKKAFGKDNVISPDLPIDPDEVKELIHDIVFKINDPIIFVGTSLGGFYAHLFSVMYQTDCVLINPSITPSVSIGKKIGINKNYATGKEFEVKKEYIDKFNDIETDLSLENDNSGVHLFLAKDDDVLDYSTAFHTLTAPAFVEITEDGGHRYDTKWDMVIEYIRETFYG
jgi:uncharacterized protein